MRWQELAQGHRTAAMQPQRGTHAELVSRHGRYAEMWQLQQATAGVSAP